MTEQAFKNFRIDQDQRGVLTATLDVPGRAVNVFDEHVTEELGALLTRLERDPAVKLVVFKSGKESGFLAGADVRRIESLPKEMAEEVAAVGQQLFNRVERLPMPTLAVIHGICLGGGLEFALACRHRIARDDARTRLGFPEVELGILPAWGGTQRMPRLIGLTAALGMILEAKKLPARKAAELGVVDRAAPPAAFEAEVERFISELLSGTATRATERRGGWLAKLRDDTRIGQSLVLHAARRRIGPRGAQYPALPMALGAVETGLRQSFEEGLACERRGVAKLIASETCRNLIGLFFQRERARDVATWVGPDTRKDVEKTSVDRLAVIGAGIMGAGIAQLAAFEGLRVVLKDVSQEFVDAGMKRIRGLFDDAVRKGQLRAEEAESRMQLISGVADWNHIADADLVIEAVPERESLKLEVFRQLDARLPSQAVLASNTSALSILQLGQATHRPECVAGLHFFNPVHRMHLVEVVKTAQTSDATIAILVNLVRRLGKTPLVVRDSPGFLVNRILFPYMNEAIRMSCEGLATEAIDREARAFGMPMGPLELLDQVGLDVAADVARTLLPLGGDPGPTVDRLALMVEQGRLGKKAGRGFYSYSGGKKGKPAHWEPLGLAPPKHSPDPARRDVADKTSGELPMIQKRLVYVLINEAARCMEEQVVSAPWMVDLGMVLGTGFAPFRGGPLRLADTWGIEPVVAQLESLQAAFGERFEPTALLQQMRESRQVFFPKDEAPKTVAAGVGGEDSGIRH